ncbi:MAG TPA: glycosyltransferase family 4 protein [Chloroflexi bacterium]|jgi:glycosyltransferase involved in cell wall biosynthesis|nr:glycosyltransferase family 4 protein [Chloroflexota bacterium]
MTRHRHGARGRIGIDYTAAVQQRAGIGRYTRGLIGALAELDREREYVLFSAGVEAEPRTWPDNFARRALPLSDRHMAIVWQRLRVPLPVELVTGRIDLFHSPDFVLPPVWRARTVLTVHDLSFLRHPECSSPPLLAYLMRAVPHSVARADILIADSESTRRDLIELLHVPEDRVFVVYAGVEERFRPEPSPEDALRRKRWGLERPYILSVGTLQPRKNFCRLIHAFHRLAQAHGAPHELVIAGGKGWLYDEIFAAIGELGLEKRVRVLGFVDDADLPALYRGADVFAFPSLYEGFGIPVLEAMGCGTPVVTSNVSSLPEVAGDAALQVPPEDVDALADALWRSISDSALRETHRTRGFEQVARFTWRRAAHDLIDVYARVAPSHGGLQ